MSIFDSRWVALPEGARERPGGLPSGFAAGGTSAGLKPSGALDVGLVFGEGRDVTSAARFTRSGVQAAPVLVTRDEMPDPSGLSIKTILNDKIMQDWHTGDMIFDVPALIEFLSAPMPSISTSTVSPTFIGLVLPGVPVKMRSPG